MPPKTRSSHVALDHPPRQTKLSARRTTRVHRRMSPTKLEKRDSTLTQLGFYHSSSPAVETQWTIPVASDAEDEDEDYQEPRAKKRRKTAGSKAKAGGKKATRDVSESQSTLTQNWRALGYVMDSHDTSDEEDLMMINEGMQPPPSGQPKQTRPLPWRRPAPDAGETQIQGDNLLGAYLDNDWSSESELDTTSKSSLAPSQLAHFAQSQEKGSTRLTIVRSDATPKTPKRITKTEIPDSAETSSSATSSRSARSGPGYVRSPLKERSTNIPSSLGLSEGPEQADRDKVSFSQVQLDDASARKKPVGQWSAKLAYTPKRSHKTRTMSSERQPIASSPTLSQSTRQKSGTSSGVARKRTFERVSTIAESEDSDVELGDIEPLRFGSNSRQRAQSRHGDNVKLRSPELGSNGPDPEVDEEIETLPLSAGLHAAMAESLPLPDEHTEIQLDGAAMKASIGESPSSSQDNAVTARDLANPQAKATEEAIAIEDSEAEEEFREDDDYTDDDLDGRPDEHNDYDDDEEYAYNQTYDPVADALARDGARAWRTETQLQRDERAKAKNEALVEESDAEIEERNEGENIVAVPSSQEEQEIVPSSQDFADPGQKLAALGSPGRTTVGDIDDSGYASQEMLKDESSKALPQSMPPPSKPQQPLPELPRLSQISTVVDTQSQRSRPNSPHGMPQPWTEQSAPSSPPDVDVGLPDDPIERSPHKSYPPTLSSSPFPMPPGFTRRARGDFTETQSSELMDFSLPPPPPLLLSSSRPQDGSSSS